MAWGQTTVTIDGNDYTVADTPQRAIFTSAIISQIQDPDGPGGSKAPRAVDGDPAYEALKTMIRSCVSATPTCNSPTTAIVLAALDCFMDADQTNSCDAAKYYINNVELLWEIPAGNTQFGCDWNVAYCGIQDFSHYQSYWIYRASLARILMDSYLSAGEKTAFAQKMLNDVTTNNDDGDCNDQFQLVSGATANYTTGTTTITGSGLSGVTAGRMILVKAGLTVTGGYATVASVESDSALTLSAPVVHYSGGNFGSISNGSVYELQPWDSSTCGAVWQAMQHEANFPWTFGERVDAVQAEPIDSSETEIDVDDASRFPTPPFVAKFSSGELVNVTAINSNTLTVTRGYWGTTAKADYSGVMTYRKYLPKGADNEDPTNNRVLLKASAACVAALSGLDELPTQAAKWIEDCGMTLKDYTIPRVDIDWAGFSQAGSYYHHAVNQPYAATMVAIGRNFTPVGGSPSLDFSSRNFIKYDVYGLLYNALPTDARTPITWGRQGLTDAPEWAPFVKAFHSGENEDEYLDYWAGTVTDFYADLEVGGIASWGPLVLNYLIFGEANPSGTDYRSTLPLHRNFSTVDDPPGRPWGVFVSRTGFSSANDTLLWASGENLYPGNDHRRSGAPAEYRIYKKRYLMTDNGSDNIEDGDKTNMMIFGGAENLKPGGTEWQEVWIDKSNGAADWSYARINAVNSYTAAALATRAIRHLVHFKTAADDYVVAYDDMASSAGNTKAQNLHYDESCSTWTTTMPDVVCRTADSSLLSKVIYPSGSGLAMSTATSTYAKRLTVCHSADGSTCDATNTAANTLVVHMPRASITGSLPTTTGLATIDADYQGVQIEDATTPAVAVFPKNGSTPQTSTSFTTSHSGTGQYLVTGLESGTYDVTLTGTGVIVDDQAVDGDGTLYFTSAAGGFTVAQVGAATPPEILTTSCPDGTVGESYSCSFSASCADTPCTWDLSVGTLSGTGLQQNSSTGAITDTDAGPTSAGAIEITVRVTDNSAQTDTQAITITVGEPPPDPGQVELVVIPGSVSASMVLGASLLPSDASCTVTLFDSAGIPLDQTSSGSGIARRPLYVTGLIASTDYSAQGDCGSAGATGFVDFTTLAAGTGTVTYTTRMVIPSILSSIADSARVTYTDTNGGCTTLCSVAVKDVTCAGGTCTMAAEIGTGRLYQITREWGSGDFTSLRTTLPAYVAIP